MDGNPDFRVDEKTTLASSSPAAQFALVVARNSTRVARRVLGYVAPGTTADFEVGRPRALPKMSGYMKSFLLLVVIPGLLIQIYLAFIASDQYVAEARFAVRAAPEDGAGSLSSLLSSLGTGGGGSLGIPSTTIADSFVVTNYIRSRAIVDDMASRVNLREIFRRPEADFWARLGANPRIEELVDYWNSMVSTNIDGPSGIVTVYVRAFRPEDALVLSKVIIELSEKLANDISARARNDTMRRAEEEVRRGEAMVTDALAEMRKYRDEQGFINPVSAADSTSKLLMQAMGEKIRAESEFFVATRSMSPTAPTVANLRARMDSADRQIEQLKSKLTGNTPEGRTISNSLVRFEELELKRQFAERLYVMAQGALERARSRAQRQSIFVEVFVPPALPEYAKFPERLALSLLAPLALLVIWGILGLTAAAVEDHRY